jgi:hypothetical protein
MARADAVGAAGPTDSSASDVARIIALIQRAASDPDWLMLRDRAEILTRDLWKGWVAGVQVGPELQRALANPVRQHGMSQGCVLVGCTLYVPFSLAFSLCPMATRVATVVLFYS